MTSKQKTGIIAAVAAVVLIAAIAGTAVIVSGNSRGDENTTERDGTIALVRDYISQQEYDRALDLLEPLLIRNPADEEAIALRNQAIEGKRALEAARASTDSNTSNQTPGYDPYAAQQAEAEARAREAAAREAEAEARRQEAELELQKQLAAQREAEEQRRREAEAAARQAEEDRLAALSEEEQALQRRIQELLDEARRLQNQDEFISARGKINQVMDIDDDEALAYARMAETYVEEDITNNDNLSRAISFSEQAITKDPDLWEPYYTLGRIFNETKQFDRAIRELSTAAELNSTNADIFYALGNAQFDARRYSDARQSYEACVFLDSSNEKAYFNLGLTFERLGQNSQALDSYRRAIAVKSDYASAYNRIGELLIASNDLDNALVNLLQAVKYDNNARNNRALARAYYVMKNYSEALKYYTVVIGMEPDRAQNQYNMAAVLLDLGRAEEALPYAAEAIRLDNSVPEYNYTLGLAIKRLGSNEQAASYFEQAIRQRSNYIKPRIELADIQIQNGDYDSALDMLLEAYRIDSSRGDVNNNLATVYRLKNLNEDSVKHSGTAIEAEPNNAQYRYNLALTMISMEAFAQAETTLRAVISMNASYWDAYMRLGEVLIALDKVADAKTVLRDLSTKAPNTEQGRQAATLLGSL